ncbi:hypothetical protein BDB00DRAFT_879711 [Zychaea mexicana]|uniref:uncharacterized protein n=1 Tax=Zychaea mexicana TaxID=64656 RepID=UPI0022FE2317|nr:uncharacterized protein BDB00DRAFT_879711 [Zychaea mexicana]KAI9474818.1 hypothetical protein BDB00DRAFT_879711 [Zychaea mexicana]
MRFSNDNMFWRSHLGALGAMVQAVWAMHWRTYILLCKVCNVPPPSYYVLHVQFYQSIPRRSCLVRSYSQSHYPEEQQQQSTTATASSSTENSSSNNNNNNSLDVLDRDIILQKSRSPRSESSDSTRDFNSMLYTLFPESQAQGSSLPPLPRKNSSSSGAKTPVDPTAAK